MTSLSLAGIADTHTALWYLLGNPRLSGKARRFMDDAAAAGYDIALSPISLAEIVYLVEKKRLPASACEELKSALSDPECVIQEAPADGVWREIAGQRFQVAYAPEDSVYQQLLDAPAIL